MAQSTVSLSVLIKNDMLSYLLSYSPHVIFTAMKVYEYIAPCPVQYVLGSLGFDLSHFTFNCALVKGQSRENFSVVFYAFAIELQPIF